MSSTLLITAFAIVAITVFLVLADCALRAKTAYGQLSQEMQRADTLTEIYVKIEELTQTANVLEAPLPRFNRAGNMRRMGRTQMVQQPKLRVAA